MTRAAQKTWTRVRSIIRPPTEDPSLIRAYNWEKGRPVDTTGNYVSPLQQYNRSATAGHRAPFGSYMMTHGTISRRGCWSAANPLGQEVLFPQNTTDIAGEVWVRPEQFTGTYTIICQAVGVVSRLMLRGDNGRFECLFTPNGVALSAKEGTLSRQIWHHIGFTLNTATNERNIYVDGEQIAHTQAVQAASYRTLTGIIGDRQLSPYSLPYSGDMGPLMMYNENKSQDFFRRRYQLGAKVVQFKTDWGHKADGIASPQQSRLGDGPFIVRNLVAGSSMKCSMDTINGTPVKVITRNGFSEVASFPISITGMNQEEAAYGSWAFWIKRSLSSSPIVQFIGASVTASASGLGYHLNFWPGENRLLLGRSGISTLIDWNPAPFDTTQWNHYHITRRYDGQFNVYVNGILIGTVTNNNTTTSRAMTITLGGVDGGFVALSDPHGGHAFTKYLGVVPPVVG